MLVLVLAVLTVSYASSLRAYLQQRSHINELKTSIAQHEANIDALETEKARWDDPAYVRAQARARLGYVMPGEKTYLVLDENGQPLEPQAELQDPTTVIRSTATPWWDDAWASVELAGDPPKAGRPPVTSIDGTKKGTGGEGSAGETPEARDGVRRRRDLAAIGRQLGRSARGVHAVGAPLPLLAARRGGHRAAAARRHAVPHHLLPDLPARGLPDRLARGLGADEGDGGPARRTTPSWRRRTPRRTSATSRRGRSSGDVPEIAGISAGGMPDRVKCLHVLAGQALAQGRGVNPLGDEVLDRLGEWWVDRALREDVDD